MSQNVIASRIPGPARENLLLSLPFVIPFHPTEMALIQQVTW